MLTRNARVMKAKAVVIRAMKHPQNIHFSFAPTAEAWAPFIQIFRDVFLLILILESILLITAFAILMLQAAAFLMLLKTEIKPILDNARQTTRTTKATAQFVNKNAVDPLIQIKSFFAGLLAFIRELIQIRALLDAGQEPQAQENEDDG